MAQSSPTFKVVDPGSKKHPDMKHVQSQQPFASKRLVPRAKEKRPVKHRPVAEGHMLLMTRGLCWKSHPEEKQRLLMRLECTYATNQ